MLEEKPGRVTVTVNVENVAGVPVDLIKRGVRAALEYECVGQADVSVTFLDDLRIREMNASYLERDCTTDVIAFSLGESDQVIGDVYIGHEHARRQAEELSETLEGELVRLAIHGALHVLGHDHTDGPERVESKMFEVQERLVVEVMTDD